MPDESNSDLIKANEHKLPFRVIISELKVRRPLLCVEEEQRKIVSPEDLVIIENRKNQLTSPAAIKRFREELKDQASAQAMPQERHQKRDKYLEILEQYYAAFEQHPITLPDALDAADNAHDYLDQARKELLPSLPDENMLAKLPQARYAEVKYRKISLRGAAENRKNLQELHENLKQKIEELESSKPENKSGTAEEKPPETGAMPGGDQKEKLSEEQRETLLKALKYYQAVAKYRCAAAAVQDAERPLKKLLHATNLSSMCFSGGGIRSASFSLGVFTELARLSASPDDAPRGVLGAVDYISTVSGGGYTGSWLTAWIKRHPDGFAGVIRNIADLPHTSVDPEAAPLRHLRDYTSYLAPHRGLFSVDAWTLAAIVLRNLLLNWIILIPLFAAALLLPLFSVAAFQSLQKNRFTDPYDVLLILAIAGALRALFYIARNMPGNFEVQPEKTSFILHGWLPLLVSAWSISAFWLVRYDERGGSWIQGLQGGFLCFWAVAFVAESGLVLGRLRRPNPLPYYKRNTRWMWGLAVVNSAFVAWLLWLLATKLAPSLRNATDNPIYLFTLVCVPLVWLVFMLTVVVMNGMTAQIDEEENREWWSRSGAIMMIGLTVWLVSHGVVLYSWPIAEAFNTLFRKPGIPPTAMVSILATVIGGLASFLGYSPATGTNKAKVDTAKLGKIGKFLSQREILIPALGALFFLVLAIAVANLNRIIIRWIGATWFSEYPELHRDFVSGLIEAAVLLLTAALANIVINVNTFSLHGMYRMRLIRSYLGASNRARKPNPFINFDSADNMAMQDAPKNAQAPLHVINMALNLVAGRKLAWQERKAESFTVTPLKAGSFRVGYRDIGKYAGEKGMTLGTAMAISGAAASPNMGYHSSPILTLVMTLFNARLGWWLPNTGEAGKDISKNSPFFSIKPLLFESFGRTTDEQPWIYLSDGGHFENLGLYEMVMRRCRTIIAVDGSADPQFSFEDLGNALRQIQIDFGIPIDFKPDVKLKTGPDGANRYCFVGEIQYGCVDQDAEPGTLIYIKAALNGTEPADVIEYHKGHPDFPHEPTSNQFYTEAQFQSYMRLGSHIVRAISKTAPRANAAPPFTMEELKTAVRP